jgi:hypothetical protein
MPRAIMYIDDQMSGLSAYSLARALPNVDRRRTHAVGVEEATPSAALSVYLALSVASTSPPSRPSRHGALTASFQTPRATLGIGNAPSMPTATLGI